MSSNNLMAIADSLAKQVKYDSSNSILKKLYQNYKLNKKYDLTVKTLNKIASNFDELGRWDSLQIYLKKARVIVETHLELDNLLTAETYYLFGSLFVEISELDSAEIYLDKSFLIRERKLGKEHQLIADILMLKGRIEFLRGNFEKVLDFVLTSHKIYKQIGENNETVSGGYNNVAIAYTYLNDYSTAMTYFDSAIYMNISRYGFAHPEVAQGISNKAVIFSIMNKVDSAIYYDEKALSIYEKVYGKGHPEIAKVLNNLGAEYQRLTDYQKAAEYFNKALDVSQSINDTLSLGISFAYLNLGDIYSVLGNFELSIKSYLKSADHFKRINGEEDLLTTDVYLFLANTYLFQNQRSKAKRYAEKSLKIRRKLFDEKSVNLGQPYYQVARVKNAYEQFDEAIYFAKKSVEIYEIAGSNEYYYLSNSYFLLSKIYFSTNDLENALKYCNKSLASFKTGIDLAFNKFESLSNFSSNSEMLNVLAFRGKIYKKLFKETKDTDYLRSAKIDISNAIKLIEEVRRYLSAETSKVIAGSKNREIYSDGIEIAYLSYLTSKNEEDFIFGLNLSEQAKALVLFENLEYKKAAEYSGVSESQLELEESLKQSIRFYSRLIEDGKNSAEPDSVEEINYQKELFNYRRKLDNLHDKFETEYQEFNRTTNIPDELTLDEIRKGILDSNQSVVEYYLADNEIFIFFISNNRYEFIKVAKPINLNNSVQTLLDGITKQDQAVFSKHSFSIYNAIFEPVEKFISGTRCLIITDGILGYIPFDALLYAEADETKNYKKLPYLINKYSFGYAFSLNVMQNSKDENNKVNNFLGIAPQLSNK
ncbi:MAG: tetratricopeptide repeat protein [Melioribacteraceae bacterium]|nr:tetratricopeptide repeat protein [Melioribacteraceae bacterium]